MYSPSLIALLVCIAYAHCNALVARDTASVQGDKLVHQVHVVHMWFLDHANVENTTLATSQSLPVARPSQWKALPLKPLQPRLWSSSGFYSPLPSRPRAIPEPTDENFPEPIAKDFPEPDEHGDVFLGMQHMSLSRDSNPGPSFRTKADSRKRGLEEEIGPFDQHLGYPYNPTGDIQDEPYPYTPPPPELPDLGFLRLIGATPEEIAELEGKSEAIVKAKSQMIPETIAPEWRPDYLKLMKVTSEERGIIEAEAAAQRKAKAEAAAKKSAAAEEWLQYVLSEQMEEDTAFEGEAEAQVEAETEEDSKAYSGKGKRKGRGKVKGKQQDDESSQRQRSVTVEGKGKIQEEVHGKEKGKRKGKGKRKEKGKRNRKLQDDAVDEEGKPVKFLAHSSPGLISIPVAALHGLFVGSGVSFAMVCLRHNTSIAGENPLLTACS